MKPATIAVHTPTRRTDGAIAPPIQLSTTYEHGPANEHIHDHEYVRDGNPNVDDLETRLSALEGADGAVVFGSGMAAAHAALSFCRAGARVLLHANIYVDVKVLISEMLEASGRRVERLDLTDLDAFQAALAEDVDLIWFETPTNPRLEILDIERICNLAKSANANVLVDSTIAPPIIQRPHDFGATFVLHSLTKYIGGHSDIQGGSLSYRGDKSIGEQLLHFRRHYGGVLSPFNAWLISRGLQTLDCRLARHSQNASRIAEFLVEHPAISKVRYPFLKGRPEYQLAARQMSAGSGIISIELKGGEPAAVEVASKLKLFVNATSFGGPESLVEHRRSVEGGASTSPPGLLRISVGLEDHEDLIADLKQALDGIR